MRRAVLLDVFGTLVHFETKRRPFLTLLRSLRLDRERRIRARRLLLASPLSSIKAAATCLAESTGTEPGNAEIAAAERDLEEHLASCRLTEGALPLSLIHI